MKIDKQIRVRFRLSDHEKAKRKIARMLKKDQEEIFHQRNFEAFSRLFEFSNETNAYISRGYYG